MKVVADVVIVGAGIIGCSAALQLAHLGRGRVIVVEKGSIGSGMTKRSGGLIRTYFENPAEARLALSSLRFYENWKERVGDSCGFTQTGVVIVAGKGDAAVRLEKSITAQRELGVNTRLMTAAELGELEPAAFTADVGMAAYEPESGYADPIAATQSLARRAKDLGVIFKTGTLAKSIRIEHGRVTGLETNTGPVETMALVVAAGPWSSRLLTTAGIEIGLGAERAELAFYDRPQELKQGHPAFIDMASNCFFRPHTYGLTLAGMGACEPASTAPLSRGDQAGVNPDRFEETVSPQSVSEIQKRVAARLPAMSGGRFVRAHAGLYDVSPDGHPILDKVPGIVGLVVAAGMGGMGMTLAPAIATCIHDLVLDGNVSGTDLGHLQIARFLGKTRT